MANPGQNPKDSYTHSGTHKPITSTTAAPKEALDVNIAASDVGIGGGTEFDDGDAIDTNSQGTLIIGTTGVSGTARAIRTNDSGAVHIHDGGGSITVDGSVTATIQEPLSVDDNGGSLTIDNSTLSTTGGGTEASALRVTVANDSTGVLSVDDNGSTLSVDDGGGSLTVDGTVGVSGTVTVDSELPAAAALADNTANPTVPGVGSFNHIFDGATWDRMPGNSTDGVTVNLGSNNDVVASQSTAANLNAQVEGTAAAGGAVGNPVTVCGRNFVLPTTRNIPDIFTAFGINTTTVIQIGANAGLYNIHTTTGGGYSSGDVAHDAADNGFPLKIGGRAIDYEPDTTGEQGRAEVAANDRVAGAFNLRGQIIEGVNPQYGEMTTLNDTYDNTTTTNTSTAVECWNYRRITLGWDVSKANTPTDITFDVEVDLGDGNFKKLMNGGVGAWIYDDITVGASGIERAYSIPIAADRFRVTVTTTGTTASNTFTIANAVYYLRN